MEVDQKYVVVKKYCSPNYTRLYITIIIKLLYYTIYWLYVSSLHKTCLLYTDAVT